MKSARIVTIGDVVADIVTGISSFPIQEGDFRSADQIYLDAGGNANFLIVAARLGMESIAMGTIGNDLWGKEILRILNKEKVNTDHLSIGGTTTIAQVLVDESGGHAFVGKYGKGPALVFDHTSRGVIEDADALFCSGYSFADDRIREFSLKALNTAYQQGVPTYFDSGPAFFELAEHLKTDILADTDILLLTEDEVPGVTSGGIQDIFHLGPVMIVVKEGADGCTIYSQGEEPINQPGFVVEVVDTTAAGDSFGAAFIAARYNGWHIKDCALFATVVGAAKVKKMGGGQNVPDKKEIQEIISEFQVELPE